jgi:hypothetical protein
MQTHHAELLYLPACMHSAPNSATSRDAAPGRWVVASIAQRTTTYRNITSQLGREADLRFGRLLHHYLLAPSLEIRAQGERLLKRRSRSVHC